MAAFVNIGGNVRQVTLKREVLEKIAELLEITPLDREKVISIYIAAAPSPPPPPAAGRRAPRPRPTGGARSAATSRPRPPRK